MGKVAIPAGRQGPAGPKINQPFTPILIAAGNAHCDLCQVWRSFSATMSSSALSSRRSKHRPMRSRCLPKNPSEIHDDGRSISARMATCASSKPSATAYKDHIGHVEAPLDMIALSMAKSSRCWHINVETPNSTPSSVTSVGMRATGLASTRPAVNGTVAEPQATGQAVGTTSIRSHRPSYRAAIATLRVKGEAGVQYRRVIGSSIEPPRQSVPTAHPFRLRFPHIPGARPPGWRRHRTGTGIEPGPVPARRP